MFYDNYGPNGFVPVTINLSESPSIVLQYARLYTYPFLRDNGSVWAVYRQNGYVPLNYIVGPDGIIRYIAEGFNEPQIDALIRQYLPDPIDHDVGVTRILAPSGSVDSATTVVPACSVYNYGDNVESYQVRMRIGTLYDEVATVSGHQPGQLRYVEFPEWQARERDLVAVRCSTELAGDDVQPNNFRDASCRVNVYDIAVLQVFAPPDTVDSAQAVVPLVEIQNRGTVPDLIKLRFEITDGYWDTTTVILQPGRRDTVDFGQWTPLQRGVFQVRCSVWGRWEMVWENNVIEQPVWVLTAGVAEGPGEGIDSRRLPTVARGVFYLPPAAGGEPVTLFDAAGRERMALKPGANDISHLSPGVYYARGRDGRGTMKVVVQQ